MPAFHLATFSADVTPPLGHPLCGGWIEPARAVDDPLRAVGVVLLVGGAPIVLCAVDWTGIRNDAHLAWTAAIAEASHTTPDRVAVQCVHPHNAPFADTEAQKVLAAVKGPPLLDLAWHAKAVAAVAESVKDGLKRARRIDSIGIGAAKVEKVASNRRVIGKDGKVLFTRTSATKDPVARAAPDGVIDPVLRTLSFRDGKTPVASLHYYATHPMSYYGDGRVTSDFCGLARDARAAEEKGVFQAYFTGCAGNVTAGKYNDGAKANRAILRDRILEGMRAAWKATTWHELKSVAWRTEKVTFAPRREASFAEAASKADVADAKLGKARRGNAALQLGWLARQKRPVTLSCLDLGPALVVHLPGEPFIEYQLAAQEARKDRFVCVAGYGDGGMGYIPTDEAYGQGGYEPTVALAAPCEKKLKEMVRGLLKG